VNLILILIEERLLADLTHVALSFGSFALLERFFLAHELLLNLLLHHLREGKLDTRSFFSLRLELASGCFRLPFFTDPLSYQLLLSLNLKLFLSLYFIATTFLLS